MRNFPPPTNLKVLPKDLTGREVRDIMQKWAGSLGVECDTCHVADPSHLDKRGRPAMNFPDDSKPEKQIARLMYTMTQQINTDTISKVMDMDKENEGTPVTCGTCHRGHKMPEEFVIPKKGPRAEARRATACWCNAARWTRVRRHYTISVCAFLSGFRCRMRSCASLRRLWRACARARATCAGLHPSPGTSRCNSWARPLRSITNAGSAAG